MALRRVSLSEAANLPLGFDVTEEMLDKSLPQLDNILKAHGWVNSQENISSSGLLKEKVENNIKGG